MKQMLCMMIVCQFIFSACERNGILEVGQPANPYGIKLSRITLSADVNSDHGQYYTYQYDKNGRIVKYALSHGQRGSEQTTLYTDYFYEGQKLIKTESFVFLNERYIKSSFETYEYDDSQRVRKIHFQSLSEIDLTTWLEGVQEYEYDAAGRLVKAKSGDEASYDLYYYDDRGNVIKKEYHNPGQVQDGPVLYTTYTYDDKKNPFYLHDGAWHFGLLGYFSPNNILSWENYSFESNGAAVARATYEYQYDKNDRPIVVINKVLSPLTDPQPGTERVVWRYEYME